MAAAGLLAIAFAVLAIGHYQTANDGAGAALSNAWPYWLAGGILLLSAAWISIRGK